MNITRHISLEDEYVEKLKPYVEKHDGNFGAAIRDMINQAGKNDTRINSLAIDHSILNWIFKENDEKLIPSDILNEFIDPVMMNSMDNLEGYLNRRFSEFKWGVFITLKYDNDIFPGEILMEISGDHQKIRFISSILTLYLVINSLTNTPLEVRSVVNTKQGIKVELSGSNNKDALISLETFFGKTDMLIRTVKSCHALLESNGHMYDARATANIVIITHRSDVGRKINEIVDNLKNSSNQLDKELLVFFGYLKRLREIPDIPMSLTSLGRRTGTSLMQAEMCTKHLLTHGDNFCEVIIRMR